MSSRAEAFQELENSIKQLLQQGMSEERAAYMRKQLAVLREPKRSRIKQDPRDLTEPLFIAEFGQRPIVPGVYHGRHFDIIAEAGIKSPGDVKLYLQPHNSGPRIPLDWCDMARAFGFMCHNESVNNDTTKGYLGANKVRQFFRKAMETNVLIAAACHGIPQGNRVDCNARWIGASNEP